jgi:hypothetical protein
MDEGAVTRDVYLPEGYWKDMNLGLYYSGPTWLRDYPAPLDTLPYFTLVTVSGALKVPISLITLVFAALLALLMQ